MRILSKGTPPSERLYVVSCPDCKSQIEYKQSEGEVSYDQRDGDSITFKCPICRRSIWTDMSKYRTNPVSSY